MQTSGQKVCTSSGKNRLRKGHHHAVQIKRGCQQHRKRRKQHSGKSQKGRCSWLIRHQQRQPSSFFLRRLKYPAHCRNNHHRRSIFYGKGVGPAKLGKIGEQKAARCCTKCSRKQVALRNCRAQSSTKRRDLHHHVAQSHHKSEQHPQNSLCCFHLIAHSLPKLFFPSYSYKVCSVFHDDILLDYFSLPFLADEYD